MTSLSENERIASIAREAIAQLAPQELPRFRAAREAYLKNPDELLGAPRGKDDMLGFGPAEAGVFLTPMVLHVATVLASMPVDSGGLHSLAGSVGELVAASLVREIVHDVFQRSGGLDRLQQMGSRLTRDQLQQLLRLVTALERARDAGMAERQAEEVVDTVAARASAPAVQE